MKKITAFAIVIVSIYACKPKKGDYMCTCEVTRFGNPKETVKDTIPDVTARDASTNCNAWGERLIQGNGTYKCVTKPL
jgi:hypothetical protein